MKIRENWHSYVPIDPKEAIPKTEYVLSKKEWDEMQARIEELEAANARFKEALEEIAEESDSGRHDGLPEPCPAHEGVVMWLRAREALKRTDDE